MSNCGTFVVNATMLSRLLPKVRENYFDSHLDKYNNYYRRKKDLEEIKLRITLEWSAIFLGLIKYEIFLLLENLDGSVKN